jgi:hypothetical protein
MFSARHLVTRILVATLPLAIVLGCIGCHHTAQPKLIQRNLTGDVFIVTKSAQNVKLGLVEVQVLPYDETKKSIERMKAQANKEIASLLPALDAARQALQTAEAQFKAARANEDEARENAGYESSILADASNERVAASRAVSSARNKLIELDKRALNWSSGAMFFAGLPPPIKSVKTDAEGKFSISLDKEAFALGARATREIGGTVENYYWLISVAFDGQISKRIFLSNDNLASSDSADSLVHVVE